MPPPEISSIVDHASPPGVSLSPDRKKVLQLYYPPPCPPITELARPELKLAGEISAVLACWMHVLAIS